MCRITFVVCLISVSLTSGIVEFALHTHFNHPNEISWITEKASLRLSQAAVMVRNQSVLLRGVNDNVETMSRLIKKLAQMSIYPVSSLDQHMLKRPLTDSTIIISTVLCIPV
jgi:lysine 2,3-aminomutase